MIEKETTLEGPGRGQRLRLWVRIDSCPDAETCLAGRQAGYYC